MPKQKQTTLPPEKLTLHADLEHVTMIPKVIEALRGSDGNQIHLNEAAESQSTAWDAFVADIKEHGILDPIKVIQDTEICVDGRHRREAAILAGLKSVPVEYVTEEEAQTLIDSTVIGRREYSTGAKAYFAVLRNPGVLNAKRGPKTGVSVLKTETLAEKYGVSLTSIEKAIFIAKGFKNKKALQKKLEPQIFAGIGLEVIRQQIIAATEGNAKSSSSKPARKINPAEAAQQRFFPIYTQMITFQENTEEFNQALYLLPLRADDPETTIGLVECENALQTQLAAVREAKEKVMAASN